MDRQKVFLATITVVDVTCDYGAIAFAFFINFVSRFKLNLPLVAGKIMSKPIGKKEFSRGGRMESLRHKFILYCSSFT